jgi:hypothetical protein
MLLWTEALNGILSGKNQSMRFKCNVIRSLDNIDQGGKAGLIYNVINQNRARVSFYNYIKSYWFYGKLFRDRPSSKDFEIKYKTYTVNIWSKSRLREEMARKQRMK